MDGSDWGVPIAPHRLSWILTRIKSAILDSRAHQIGHLGFSHKSNRLSWILAHIKRPVILSPVFQGEGPPYFVLCRRRDAAQHTPDLVGALPRVPTYNAGVLRPEKRGSG